MNCGKFGAATWCGALIVAATVLGCGGPAESEPDLSPTPSPTVTPTPTPLPTATPIPSLAPWRPPAAALEVSPGLVPTPSGYATMGRQSSSRMGVLSGESPPPPEGCETILVTDLVASDVMGCAERALREADSVRARSSLIISDDAATDAWIEVEAEGALLRSGEGLTDLSFSVGGVVQLRSAVIQTGQRRYNWVESYDPDTGVYVVTDGWQLEEVADPDRSLLLNGVRLEYLMRVIGDRTGLMPPQERGCAANDAVEVIPQSANGRVYYVVTVRMGEAGAAAIGCRDYMEVASTHWIDQESFRPWRVVFAVSPSADARKFSERVDRVHWSGQTLFTEYDQQFDVQPPSGVNE